MDDLTKGSSAREKLKPMRGCLKNKVKPPAKLAKSNMDMESTSSKEILSSTREKLKPIRSRLKTLDFVNGSSRRETLEPIRSRLKTNDFVNGSSRREKLEPIRSRLKTRQLEGKPPVKVAESKMDMDSMSLKDMLRFLDEEEVLLTQLQSKMSEEISRLQVEEHVFLHTLKIYGENHEEPNGKCNENQQQSSSEDQELIDALNLALKDNGETVPDKKDVSGATCI